MSQPLLQDSRLMYPGCIMAIAAIIQLLADPKCLVSKLPGDGGVLIPKGPVVLVAGFKMIVVPYLRVTRGHSPNSLVGQQLDLPGSTASQNRIVCGELLDVFDGLALRRRSLQYL